MATSKRIHQMTVPQWEKAFPTDAACMTYLCRHRWPTTVTCPRCGSDQVRPMETMAFKWQCYGCSQDGYRFSVLVGTVFENTNVGLRTWFRVIHMMLTSKKGVSAHQIYRTMGFGSYRTAWHMCHRVRAGLANEDFRKLMGVVEVDETFVGGLAKNRHWDKRGGGGATGGSGKAIVAGAVSRKGLGPFLDRFQTSLRRRGSASFCHSNWDILPRDQASGELCASLGQRDW